tara:strand:- start:2 stop:451 length:450 start_codon:yes stop_codon:yes gene_type:complete
LKLLEGNRGKRAQNAAEPKPNPLMDLKPPMFLNKYGKAEWKRIVPVLSSLGLLTEVDRAALAGYCNAYGTWEEATREMRGKSMLIFTEKGYPVQNPLLNVVNKQSDIMKGYLVEFGMTPAARSRVTSDSGDEEADPFMALVNRKNGGSA